MFDEERDATPEENERSPSFGRPRARVGPTVAAAGFASFHELAIALGVSREFLSRVRHGQEVPSERRREELSALLGVPEEKVMDALSEDPNAVDPAMDGHRVALLSALAARVDVLNDEHESDEHELRAPPGPMVPHDSWTAVARAARCSERTLARIRSGADVPTADMLERLGRALLVPPDLALVALRRPWTGWNW